MGNYIPESLMIKSDKLCEVWDVSKSDRVVKNKSTTSENIFRVVQQNKVKLTLESTKEPSESVTVSIPEPCGYRNDRSYVAGPVWKHANSAVVSDLRDRSGIWRIIHFNTDNC